MTQTGLFDSVPDDLFQFGRGAAFMPRKVPDLLGFKKEDVSHLASVSAKSVWASPSFPDGLPSPLSAAAPRIEPG